MRDSEDDSEQKPPPPAAECERRCKNFAEKPGTDSALVVFYLQELNWNVDAALNAFFESNRGSGDSTSKAIRVLYTDSNIGAKMQKTTEATSNESSSRTTVDLEPHRIRLMTWNIDGRCIESLGDRTLAVCETINKENPHIVFLQEVVPSTYKTLEEQCPTFQIVPGSQPGSFGGHDYFTSIMLKLDVVTREEHEVIPFKNSVMMRNMLIVKCKVKGEKFTVITSHLESTKKYAKERIYQLRDAFRAMQKIETDRTVIFGGDLNLREKELHNLAGPPKGIVDVWEASGQRPEAAYTWDMSINDNLTFPVAVKAKFRFDRLYIRHPISQVAEPVYTELVGLERVKSCGKFPSDHWAILTHYNILSKVTQAMKKVFEDKNLRVDVAEGRRDNNQGRGGFRGQGCGGNGEPAAARPKLKLKPRSVKEPVGAPAPAGCNSNKFGTGKPRDEALVEKKNYE